METSRITVAEKEFLCQCFIKYRGQNDSELRSFFTTWMQKNQLTLEKIEQELEQMGEHRKARLIVLRGYFKKQKAAFLADLAGLSLEEVAILIKGFNDVKKAWKKASVPVGDLALKTTLTELEIHSIVQLLDSTRPINIPPAQ